MSDTPMHRRQFVQGMGVLGAGALALGSGASSEAAADGAVAVPVLPTRRLGRNGPMVSMLAFGGDMPNSNAPNLINMAWASGFRYFDTAQKYGQAREEAVYGRWFERFPERRKELFLVSKDYPRKGPEQLLEMIDQRLALLKVDHLDLFFIHQLCPEVYGPESVEWPKSDRFRKVAEKLKASGKCKMVGFSCHGGPEYIQAAADGGFLDAVMVQYSPFYERGGAFDRALTACHEKGIGLIAMKTLRHVGDVPKRIPAFEKRGLSTRQAILHAVWSDPRISAICNSIQNFDQMKSSLAAAHGYDKPLEVAELEELRDVVLASRRTMCPGCPSCDAMAATTRLAFRDIARYTTYFEQDRNPEARVRYHALPDWARDASATDLAALRDGCAFNVDYPDVLARAQRYFG